MAAAASQALRRRRGEEVGDRCGGGGSSPQRRRSSPQRRVDVVGGGGALGDDASLSQLLLDRVPGWNELAADASDVRARSPVRLRPPPEPAVGPARPVWSRSGARAR